MAWAGLLAWIAGIASVCSQDISGTSPPPAITIAGSGTVYPVAIGWQSLLPSNYSYSIEFGGSSTGARRVCAAYDDETHVHIGMMSRDWRTSEAERLDDETTLECLDRSTGERTGRRVTQLEVGLDGISLAVKRNGAAHNCLTSPEVGGLTTAQLRWIFSDWSDEQLAAAPYGNVNMESIVPGNNHDGIKQWSDLHPSCAQVPIHPYGGGSKSGTTDVVANAFFNGEVHEGFLVCNLTKVAYLETLNSEETVEYISTYRDNMGSSPNCLVPSEVDDYVMVKDWLLADPGGIAYFGYAFVASFYSQLSATRVGDDPVLGIGDTKEAKVSPSPYTILDGSYGVLSRKLYMNVDNTAWDTVRNYLLSGFSAEGQAEVARIGYLGINAALRARNIIRIQEGANLEADYINLPPDHCWNGTELGTSTYVTSSGITKVAYSCDPCSPGSFKWANSPTACHHCHPGTMSSQAGASACDLCGVGSYTNNSRSTQCLACPAGSATAAHGSTSCSTCQPGKYSSTSSSSECTLCSPGRHQPNSGASSCEDCPAGAVSTVQGAVECKECPTGFYKNTSGSSSECDRCLPGWYSNETMATECTECSFGTTLYGSSDSQSLCTCPAGTFLYVGSDLPQSHLIGWLADLPESARCLPCNEHMAPCAGGRSPNSAHQRPGFHISPDATRTYHCASQDACPGGYLGECPEHSEGPGCATCSAGSIWDGDKCRPCAAKDWLSLLFFPIAALILFIFAYRLANDPIGRSVSSGSEFIVLVGLSISVVFFFNCFAALEVEWEQPMRFLVRLARDLSPELPSFALSCSVSWSPVASMTLSSCLPIVAACLTWLCAWLGVGSPQKLFNTFAGIIYAGFLLLVLHGLKPFRFLVHPLGSGKSLLFMPSVFEGSADHTQLVVIGLAVVVCYCIPFLAACLWASVSIIRSGQPSRRRWFLTSFGFLFYKFRPHAFYWGVVVLLRNLVFALAPSLWPEEPVMAVFVLCAAAVISAASVAWTKPWRARWMSAVDMGIMIFVALTLLMAKDWIPARFATSNNKLVVFMTLVAAMAMSAACIFVTVLVARMACKGKAYREQMSRQFTREIEAIEKKFLDVPEDPNQEVADALSSLMEEMDCSRSSEASEVALPEALHRISKRTCDIDGAVMGIVRQIRRRDYTLMDFYEDCIHAFPELELYAATENMKDDWDPHPASATPGQIERLRTIGALFAVYWVCRLDIDGREGLSFGVSPQNLRQVVSASTAAAKEELLDLAWGKMSPELRRAHLYWNFDWAAMERVFQQAGIIKVALDGSMTVDDRRDGRLVAMLCLTAFHDIMKIPGLCPRLMDEYEGYKAGDVILDHDIALAYLLDRYPRVLPSFRELSDEQRRAIRFTQGDLGFNAGWLVQAEGPPSAVLSKLKQATVRGCAKDADVAFYFAHWVTDLAGAEPTPFKGTEKFAVKFPPAVLQGLLGCFSSVGPLAHCTETEVYESYITRRWLAFDGVLGFAPEGRERTAKMRLNCMAQHAAKPLLDAFDELPNEDQETLISELAATGLPGQTFSEWKQELPSSAFLIYYGPAWCQRVGESHPQFCLQVLAAVFRLAREAFSRRAVEEVASHVMESEEQHLHRTVHVGQLKTVPVEAFEGAFRCSSTCMQVLVENSREATLHISIMAL